MLTRRAAPKGVGQTLLPTPARCVVARQMTERGARAAEPAAGRPEDDLLARVLRIQTGGSADWTPRSPLKRLQDAMADATARFDQFKHVMAEPEAAAAQLVGSMVSKDYGIHERPHTEHHLYRDRGGPRAAARDQPRAEDAQQQARDVAAGGRE